MFGIVPMVQRRLVSMCGSTSALAKFISHPAGIFTIFFWAPTFKWMITISNIGDLDKPAHLISANQQIAIFLTGVIWSRYSTQIVPVNYNLLIVNFFMALSAGYQLYRKTQVPEELGGFWNRPYKKPVAAAAKKE